MAEGVFRSIALKPPYQGLKIVIDSAGTGGYDIGSSPDPRTMFTLEAHGIMDYIHQARKVRLTDFEEFDYIFAMDRSNLYDLQCLQRELTGKAKVKLFGEYSGGKVEEEVKDPHNEENNEGFKLAYEQCVRFSNNFLAAIFSDVDNCHGDSGLAP